MIFLYFDVTELCENIEIKCRIFERAFAVLLLDFDQWCYHNGRRLVLLWGTVTSDYIISDEYISFLRKKYPRIYLNKEDVRTHTRKYLGVVLEIAGHNFYIPLSSPKKHDYMDVDGEKIIRKDSLIVLRIVSMKDGKKVLKGTLQIGR